MKSIGPEESIKLSGNHRRLSYRPEFKDFIKMHPGAMLKTVELIEEIITYNKNQSLNGRFSGGELVDGDIKVEYVDRRFSDIFKVTIGADAFFVKRDKIRNVGIVGGQNEYNDSLIAKQRLQNDPDVEIIDFQLGYTKNVADDPVAYFVSKWEDLSTVTHYLGNHDLSMEEREEIRGKVGRAKKIFRGYYDVSESNMFYDPATKKIKMFDINTIDHRSED